TMAKEPRPRATVQLCMVLVGFLRKDFSRWNGRAIQITPDDKGEIRADQETVSCSKHQSLTLHFQKTTTLSDDVAFQGVYRWHVDCPTPASLKSDGHSRAGFDQIQQLGKRIVAHQNRPISTLNEPYDYRFSYNRFLPFLGTNRRRTCNMVKGHSAPHSAQILLPKRLFATSTSLERLLL